jgi:hypothetical protein
MKTIKTIIQSPDGKLDQSFTWDDYLAEGEVITLSTVIVAPTGPVVSDVEVVNGNEVRYWLEMGEQTLLYHRYRIHCYIETNQGRSDSREVAVVFAPTIISE